MTSTNSILLRLLTSLISLPLIKITRKSLRLLVDGEENYQDDVKSLLNLFMDKIAPSHSSINCQGGGLKE